MKLKVKILRNENSFLLPEVKQHGIETSLWLSIPIARPEEGHYNHTGRGDRSLDSKFSEELEAAHW